MEEKEADKVVLTIDELTLIIEALNTRYVREILKSQKKNVTRTKKVTDDLIFIQTTMQRLIVVKNLRTGVYDKFAETSGSIRNEELAGDQGENSSSA